MTTQRPSPGAAIVLGLLFASFGAIPILGWLDVLELRRSRDVPEWLGVCVGVVFILAGGIDQAIIAHLIHDLS